MDGWERAWTGIERAVADVATGRPVIVLDGEDRENEGDLIFAATWATPELVAFMARHTSGYICVSMPGEDCDRLDLPPTHHINQDCRGTAYTVTVDARLGVSTGISAADRSPTLRGVESLSRVNLPTRPHPENLRYLRTKRDRMGHALAGLGEPGAAALPLPAAGAAR